MRTGLNILVEMAKDRYDAVHHPQHVRLTWKQMAEQNIRDHRARCGLDVDAPITEKELKREYEIMEPHEDEE